MNIPSGPDMDRRAPPPRASHGLAVRLCRKEQIQWILRRERARADRTRQGFSLVLFATASGPRAHHRLGRILCRRARATDDVGYFDDADNQQLCAVLPATT